MTTIATHGFLSEESERSLSAFEHKHAELCRVYREVGGFAHRAKYEFRGGPRDLQQILVASLFGRALSAYEAIFLLASRGMLFDSETALRTLVETTFSALAADKSHANAAKIVGSAEVERLRHIRLSRAHRLKEETSEESASLDALVAKIKADIAGKRFVKVGVPEIAKWADEPWMYAVPYSYLCMSAHPNARRLGESIRTNPNGDVREIRWGPSYDSLEENLALSMGCLCQIMRCRSLNMPAALLSELNSLRPPSSSSTPSNDAT